MAKTRQPKVITSTGCTSELLKLLDAKTAAALALATRSTYIAKKRCETRKRLELNDDLDLPVSIDQVEELLSHLRKTLAKSNETIPNPHPEVFNDFANKPLRTLKLSNQDIIELLNFNLINRVLLQGCKEIPRLADMVMHNSALKEKLPKTELTASTIQTKFANAKKQALTELQKPIMMRSTLFSLCLSMGIRRLSICAIGLTIDLIFLNPIKKFVYLVKAFFSGFYNGWNNATIADSAATVTDSRYNAKVMIKKPIVVKYIPKVEVNKTPALETNHSATPDEKPTSTPTRLKR